MTSRNRVPVVGIIGGIGSGKSSLARGLAERMAVHVISADSLGHDALRDALIQRQLVDVFGPDILDQQGDINRSALGRLVFGGHPESQGRRQQLEAIVHPWIRQAVQRQINAVRSSETQLILLDAAVLLEAGWAEECDLIIFVDADPQIRADRVQQNRGWAPGELERREASQLPLDQKRRAAHIIVRNDSDLTTSVDELEARIRSYLQSIHTA